MFRRMFIVLESYFIGEVSTSPEVSKTKRIPDTASTGKIR
jgi:hypothetical protein